MSKRNGDKMERIRVVAAVIRYDDKILAISKDCDNLKDRWEFPSGKIAEGETPEQALVRQIKNKLEADIEVGKWIDTIEYDYPTFHLSMECYWANVVTDELVLKEASDSKWLIREELDSVNWLPTDVMLIERINRVLLNDECVKYSENDLLKISGVNKVLEISKEKLLKIKKRSLKNEISKACSGENLWALFGYIDETNMVCLQVASAYDIETEIVNDLYSMQPLSDDHAKPWSGKFYKNIFNVRYGLSSKYQKYRDMYVNYNGFFVVSIDHQRLIKEMQVAEFDAVKYAEVLFAFKTRSVYWNPFGVEHKILKSVEEEVDGSVH